MVYTKESDFEEDLIKVLSTKGWEKDVIKYPTEKDLLENWKNILFENNRGINKLNNVPLTDGEMRQILDQISAAKTPMRLNEFINGKTVGIVRDNPEDTVNCGHKVDLKIYDRQEIAAGQSRYQIVQQPKFAAPNAIFPQRRGDIMLLINGMPLFHIELKKSGIPVSQAYNQIEKYSKEGIFTGLFSLIQIFVAMEPDETVYFANPGQDGMFNKDFYFHWADFNNEPINNWKDVASSLLSIPMAHQLIGFYTVADHSDGILKVMRSYQYIAANKISDRVSNNDWYSQNPRGGYIWHTTGSGKTLTSFKSAQLIANSQDADKVIFLVDRIELGTQSLNEYRNFAGNMMEVQATESADVLIAKLKSSNFADTLIVTSIQKMSRIKQDGLKSSDIDKLRKKRIVIIVDEAHRDVFGEMLRTIKDTFPNALFFGFTGTPILDANSKNGITLATIFGDALHRYSIADGIRDRNVLGFDPDKILTYKDKDLRKAIALEQAKASSEEEALADPQKAEVYQYYMSPSMKMAGYTDANGKYIKGIEDLLPNTQYDRIEHKVQVVTDIKENWRRLSHNGKFHAIFATSSIPDAVEYYRLIKKSIPDLKITALFDPAMSDNPDGGGCGIIKKEGIAEIISDYNRLYQQSYNFATHSKFKKDLSARLAHKKPYERIARTPSEQIDLLIVVNQMLTGFDSKWVNTLYLDKVLKYENIIQAFSRTNRLFGPEKPFGIIRYYRKPHTMQRNIDEAVKLYSGDKPLELFVDKLDNNLIKLNSIYDDICELFALAGVPDFEKLPEDKSACGKFAKLFKSFNLVLESSKIQGFKWSQRKYKKVEVKCDEKTYLILALRYKELFSPTGGAPRGGDDIPYEIDGYLTEIDTGMIDSDYMNSRFKRYLKALSEKSEDLEEITSELHKSFAELTSEEQKYANIFLHDIQNGDVKIDGNKSFREYVTEYRHKAKNDQISKISEKLGLDESKLREMMKQSITEATINQYGYFDDLKDTVDKQKARDYFQTLYGRPVSLFETNRHIDELLKNFILKGGFEI